MVPVPSSRRIATWHREKSGTGTATAELLAATDSSTRGASPSSFATLRCFPTLSRLRERESKEPLRGPFLVALGQGYPSRSIDGSRLGRTLS